jgi:hypothetical protein
MNDPNATLMPYDDWYAVIDLATQSVDSPHSKRAYSRALLDFLEWYEGNGRPGFSKATIHASCQPDDDGALSGADAQPASDGRRLYPD